MKKEILMLAVGVGRFDGRLESGPALLTVNGKSKLMVPLNIVKGRGLQAQKQEAHRLIDECVDAYLKG